MRVHPYPAEELSRGFLKSLRAPCAPAWPDASSTPDSCHPILPPPAPSGSAPHPVLLLGGFAASLPVRPGHILHTLSPPPCLSPGQCLLFTPPCCLMTISSQLLSMCHRASHQRPLTPLLSPHPSRSHGGGPIPKECRCKFGRQHPYGLAAMPCW